MSSVLHDIAGNLARETKAVLGVEMIVIAVMPDRNTYQVVSASTMDPYQQQQILAGVLEEVDSLVCEIIESN